ncbi:MAG: DUF4384 domain-containing protein [Myxococcales bacterium]|nr:DUF4384 domain-containing protein [Myxococcales bacterium]MCB9700995.1 DUF4384 domain-containing protein [Myxococcales bacterium]
MIPLDRTRSDHDDDACLSDLVLDQVRVGELEREAIAAHLARCARCRERQRALAEADVAVDLPPLSLPPPEVAPRPGRRRWWARAGVGGLAIAAAALLVIIVRPDPSVDAPTTRTKGGAALHFHVLRGGAVLEGGPGELLRPGDALRFAYSWSEGGTIAVLSRDGAGTISTYFPEGERSFAAPPGEQIDLPGAVLLDDVLGDEVLFGIFCADEVPLAALARAIEARPDDPSIPGCVVDRVRVRKRGAP